MTATIAQVRNLTGDTTSPYLFDDGTVQEALDAAAEYLDVQTTTALGIRAHKFQSAIFLVTDDSMKIAGRTPSKIKEGDAELTFDTMVAQMPTWQTQLDDTLAKLIDLPFGVVYDAF